VVEELRKTGIAMLGDIPWGSHLCHFYETKEDLLDILMPYFKTGLETNEFCLWVVSDPLGEEEARNAFRQAVPEADRYLAAGQIEIVPHTSLLSSRQPTSSADRLEIVPHTDWYLKGGAFVPERVINGWNAKLTEALAKGYAGMRVNGNEAWLTEENWKDFSQFEKTLDETLANQQMIVLCSYPLSGASAVEILDVVNTHQLAIVRRRGTWEVIESPELNQAKAEIKRLNEALEQRVVERTRQLEATNERLRTEIVERKNRETELERISRALRLVSDSNLTLVRLADEITVLNEICRIAVEVGGYRMAWVGFAEQDERKTVRPVAQAGFEAGYLESVIITWGEGPHAHGPAGTVIRTGQPYIARNIPGDPAFGPWREAATQRGYLSSIALPLHSEGRTFGILVIYAEEVDAFDAAEVKVLMELANDLAFGLTVVRTRAEHKRAEEALRTSEARLQAAIDAANIGLWDWDLVSGRLISLGHMDKLFGFAPGELRGDLASFEKRIHPDDVAELNHVIQCARDEGSEYAHEYRVIWPDGTLHWIAGRGRFIYDETGQPVRMYGAVRDITERKQAEEALQRAEKLFRAIVQDQREMIVRWKPDGTRTFVNKAYCRTFGKSYDELVGSSFWPLVSEPYRKRVLERIRNLTPDSPYSTAVHESILPGGKTQWQEWSDRGFFDEQGRLVELQSVGRDITERKRAEEALRESETKLKEAQQLAQIGYWERDLIADRISLSEETCRIFGLQSYNGVLDEAKLQEVIHPDDRHLQRQALSEALQESRLYDVEFRIALPDGNMRFVHVRDEIVYDELGRPIRMFGAVQDITERKQAEEEIRRHAARMAMLAVVSQALAKVGLDVQAVLETIVRQIAEVMGDGCVISLLSSDEQWLQQVAFHHPDPKARALIESAPLNLSLPANEWIAHLLRTGQGMLMPIVDQEQLGQGIQPEHLPLFEQFSPHSMLLVPLRVESRVIGTLTLGRDDPGHPYTPDDQALLQELADRAALTIQNAQLFEAEAQRRQEAETLREATAALTAALDLNQVLNSLLTHLARVITYDSASVLLREGEYLHVVAGQGFPNPEQVLDQYYSVQDDLLFNEIQQTGRLLILADAQAEPRFVHKEEVDYIRGWLGVPLRVSDEVIGFLTLDSRQVAAYGQAEAELAQAFANQAAIAIENARLFEQAQGAHERLQALSHRLLEVHEAERRHIAGELHDEIGQLLTGLKFLLEIKRLLPAEALQARLDKALRLADELTLRLQELSLDLRPPMLDELGLLPTLAWHFKRYTDQTNIQVDFKYMGPERRLGPEIETSVYRLVQEALTNVARHAKVSEVSVQVWVDPHSLRLQIEDRGVGFDLKAALAARRSSGLSGMYERAALLGGQLTIVSAPGAGASLMAEFPLSDPY
jgi:PAS domain S-box-containing protein